MHRNWGLVEDRSELLVFHALLPCTVVLAFDLDGGNASAPGASAHVATRACFAGAAHGTAKATGARRAACFSACRLAAAV